MFTPHGTCLMDAQQPLRTTAQTIPTTRKLDQLIRHGARGILRMRKQKVRPRRPIHSTFSSIPISEPKRNTQALHLTEYASKPAYKYSKRRVFASRNKNVYGSNAWTKGNKYRNAEFFLSSSLGVFDVTAIKCDCFVSQRFFFLWMPSRDPFVRQKAIIAKVALGTPVIHHFDCFITTMLIVLYRSCVREKEAKFGWALTLARCYDASGGVGVCI